MSRRGSRFFFLSAVSLTLAILLSSPLGATVEGCNVCFDGKKAEAIEVINSIESNYDLYRAAEVSIRDLYYHALWKARRRQLDPLSEDERNKGKRDEERLLIDLEKLEAKSLAASNQIIESIKLFHSTKPHWSACCAEKKYADQLSGALKKTHKILDEFKDHFEHVFEAERDYRHAVMVTAGGKSGNYPLDAVEEDKDHAEFYWRFEREREVKRFEEDAATTQLMNDARHSIQWNTQMDSCCLACERAAD